jgi:uncharacterized membrane-anchored protein YitT (DUF2179 family)
MEFLKNHPVVKKLLHLIKDYLLITVGACLIAVAVDVFMTPNKVVSAGVTGLGMLAFFLWKLPIGMVSLGLNLPLFLVGIRWGGGARFFFRTIYAVVVLSLAIDLMAPYLPEVKGDPLIYILFGGLLDGLGVGLVLRGRGTTGGTDIVAQVLQRTRQITFGQVFFWSNTLVLLISIPVVGLELVLYALVLNFISSRVLDAVQEGMGYARSVLIVSEQKNKVSKAILSAMDRGATILTGRGAYTGSPRNVLWVVVSRSQITFLRRLVAEIDPRAFMVVTQAHQVMGEGFRSVTGKDD